MVEQTAREADGERGETKQMLDENEEGHFKTVQLWNWLLINNNNTLINHCFINSVSDCFPVTLSVMCKPTVDHKQLV